MYQNLFKPTPLPKSNNSFPIRLAAIPLPEKAVYVNSVCAALIDSRFGLGRSASMFIKTDEKPIREDAMFGELIDGSAVPSFFFDPEADIAGSHAGDTIHVKLTRLSLAAAEADLQTRSPSTQGRGSP